MKKKFILQLFIFSIPVVIATFVLDVVLTKSLKRSRRSDYAVWNDLFNSKINSDIVIYGGSRAFAHFNPKIIEDSLGLNTYNLGINGHNFYMEYLRHKILLKYNKKPKLIILSLDYNTLQKGKDLYNSKQFLPYLKDPDVRTATSTYNGFDYFDYHLPLIRYTGRTKELGYAMSSLVHPGSKTSDYYKGHKGRTKQWSEGVDAILESTKKITISFDSATVILFESFIKETIKAGINLIFVYTPEQIKGQKFVLNRDQMFSLFHYFSDTYHIPFYDYSNDSICYNKQYFYNSAHLNAEGADLFTREFIKNLRKEVSK